MSDQYKRINAAHQELAKYLGIPDETLHSTIAEKALDRLIELEGEYLEREAILSQRIDSQQIEIDMLRRIKKHKQERITELTRKYNAAVTKHTKLIGKVLEQDNRIGELTKENKKLKSKIETIERNLRKFLRGRP